MEVYDCVHQVFTYLDAYMAFSHEVYAGLLVKDPYQLQRQSFGMACCLILSRVRVLTVTVLNLLLRHFYLDLLMNNHEIFMRNF